MLLWFKDLMNVTEKLQSIDPTFRHSCPVPSSGVKISGDILNLSHLIVWLVRYVCSDKAEFSLLQKN